MISEITSDKKKLVKIGAIVFGSGVLLAVLLNVFGPKAKSSDYKLKAPFVDVIEVNIEDKSIELNSDGVIEPRTQSVIISEVAGKVVKVTAAFENGAFVKKGEVLLKLELADLQVALRQAQLSLAKAKVAYEREKLESKIAADEWASEEEGPAPALALRLPQLKEAKAQFQAARAGVKKAKLDIKRATIRAPYDGRLKTRYVDLGHFVKRGDRIADVYATDYAEVRLALSQDELQYVDIPQGAKKRGALVSLSTANAKRAPWQGYVVGLEAEIDAKTRLAYLRVRVSDPFSLESKQKSAYLLPGTFVSARIRGKLVKNIAVLPRTALRPGKQVFVVDEDKKIEIRKVELLRKTHKEVFIAAGLEQGARVIVSELKIATDGMQVRLRGTD